MVTVFDPVAKLAMLPTVALVNTTLWLKPSLLVKVITAPALTSTLAGVKVRLTMLTLAVVGALMTGCVLVGLVRVEVALVGVEAGVVVARRAKLVAGGNVEGRGRLRPHVLEREVHRRRVEALFFVEPQFIGVGFVVAPCW